jgi:hypothetical protein
MRGRVAIAVAVPGALGTVRIEALSVVRDSMDAGLAGAVGVIAVLVGAVGLVFGLTRHRRQSVAKRATAAVPAAAVVPVVPVAVVPVTVVPITVAPASVTDQAPEAVRTRS